MDPKQLVMLPLQLSILVTLFGFGLRATRDDLFYLVRRPALLLRSLLSVFVVMPIAAVAMASMFDIRPTAAIALIALSISPIPPLLPKREAKAGGPQGYGLSLMATLALLSIVLVPAAAEVLQRVFDRPLGVAPGAVTRIVLTMAVLPLLAGMGVRAVMPALAHRAAAPMALAGTVLLALAVLALLAATWQVIWDATGGGAIVAMIAFVVVGVAAGHLLGGPNREHSTVLALSSACRHPVIALLIASANFPGERFAGTVLLYVIISFLLTLPYLAWQKRH
jgi:BASS family bile acid:Na+ symporter